MKSGREADYLVLSYLRRAVTKENEHCKKNEAQKVEDDLWSKPTNFRKYINRYMKHSKDI